ncbi:MAG: MerC domain-containing protein, partial [Pirellula sp.]
MQNWKDRLGIFTSVACAIHCAATPVLLATLPA